MTAGGNGGGTKILFTKQCVGGQGSVLSSIIVVLSSWLLLAVRQVEHTEVNERVSVGPRRKQGSWCVV